MFDFYKQAEKKSLLQNDILVMLYDMGWRGVIDCLLTSPHALWMTLSNIDTTVCRIEIGMDENNDKPECFIIDTPEFTHNQQTYQLDKNRVKKLAEKYLGY
jgi:hypothetical protein